MLDESRSAEVVEAELAGAKDGSVERDTRRPVVGCGELLRFGLGVSACKLAGRERFIGYQEPARLENLQLVFDNARFLILPWI